MIPYLGCEHARELLEGFVDGELPMADQVAVESHLRWCRTCAARVEDMRLIGASMRLALACRRRRDDARALAAIQSDVLTRVRAEREQSFAVARARDVRRTCACCGRRSAPRPRSSAVCVASLSVLQAATRASNPESLAAMIEPLRSAVGSGAAAGQPGDRIRIPMRLDGRVSFPRALDGVSALESISDEEVTFAVSAVVTREGRIANYELLQSDHASAHRRSEHDAAEVDMRCWTRVKRSRFAPAQTRQAARGCGEHGVADRAHHGARHHASRCRVPTRGRPWSLCPRRGDTGGI